MRIRLVVHRPELAPTRLWWPLADALQRNPHYSISDLITSVNDIFPLDNTVVGLEDYVVELDNAEFLHFMNVGNVFRDGDEIT